MIENISKKQEKVQEKIQEKIQKQQKLNDKDCRELTDEELDQIVGGVTRTQLVMTTHGVLVRMAQMAMQGAVTAKVVATDEAVAQGMAMQAQAVTLDK